MGSLSSNKKIIITVASFVLLIVVFAAVLRIAGNNPSSAERETTTLSGGTVDEVFDSQTEAVDTQEYTSSTAADTIPDMSNNVSTTISDAIVAYMSGQYYIDGYMTSGGEKTEMNLAISGKNFYTSTEMEGMRVSILYKNGKIYLINDEKKHYLEFSELLAGTYDVDFSEMEEISEALNLTQYNFTGFEMYDGTVDGEEADCFKYFNDEMCVIFFFVNDELKQIDMGDGNANINSSVIVNEFSPEVPDGVMSLSGLRKTTLMAFFGESLAGLR